MSNRLGIMDGRTFTRKAAMTCLHIIALRENREWDEVKERENRGWDISLPSIEDGDLTF